MKLKSKLLQCFLERHLRKLIIEHKNKGIRIEANNFSEFLIFFEQNAFKVLQNRMKQKGLPISIKSYYPEFSNLIKIYSQMRQIPCWNKIIQAQYGLLWEYKIQIQNSENHLQLIEFIIKLHHLWKANLGYQSK